LKVIKAIIIIRQRSGTVSWVLSYTLEVHHSDVLTTLQWLNWVCGLAACKHCKLYLPTSGLHPHPGQSARTDSLHHFHWTCCLFIRTSHRNANVFKNLGTHTTGTVVLILLFLLSCAFSGLGGENPIYSLY